MLLRSARVAGPACAAIVATKIHQQQQSLSHPLDSDPKSQQRWTTASHNLPSDIHLHKLLHLTELGFPSAAQPNPSIAEGSDHSFFVGCDECVLTEIVRRNTQKGGGAVGGQAPKMTAFKRAGARHEIHFEPHKVRAAIVNCGGLCPGLNNVIKTVVEQLDTGYGVDKVFGITGGYRGFHSTSDPNDPSDEWAPVLLTPEVVADWHHDGGTNLSSARGGFDQEVIISFLKKHRINQLYVLGGDGTHRGAYKLAEACAKQKMNVAVCGIPKTIDNDIGIIDYSFGFKSAVGAAQAALKSAQVEAKGNKPNGIGVVKLMGRSSGYIAAYSTIANGSVDLCLIPEVDVELEGERSVLKHLQEVVAKKGHAVVVVAEGAGESVLGQSAEVDAGGNKKLPAIGEFMVQQINQHFEKQGLQATVKYIDPSYTIRSVPANSDDAYYCHTLGAGAVHGAMAGFTGFSVGLVNNHTVMIPIPALVAKSPRTLRPEGRTWDRVVNITGQPRYLPPKKE
mmetsp:Transcript_43282/g.87524  ORF Transcript_43282/g.87524 Transcript_43282/m.87524 type:complete len:508 (+) Transcript_43282:29-1552(+)